jgi:Ca-activated chloride channel family protein
MDDDKMTDDALMTLKDLHSAAPSPETKKLALNAAMAAFDAAQSKRPVKAGWMSGWKLSAGLGVPLGTAVAALVLLPLGTQLYLSEVQKGGAPAQGEVTVAAKNAPTAPTAVESADRDAVQVNSIVAAPAPEPAKPVGVATMQAAPQEQRAMAPVAKSPAAPAPEAAMAPQMDAKLQAAPVTEETTDETMPADAPVAADEDEGEADLMVMPSPPEPMADGAVAGGVMANTVPTEPSGDTFAKFDENRVQVTKDAPVSTFSIDVDTASYSYVRSTLEQGFVPEPDAVRLEELINYFPYDYPAPTSLDTPFKATMAVVPTPWNAKTELLEIGIKGYVPPPSARQPENLTFLIDTSGSMDEPNKLPLLKRSFALLVDQMRPTDTISIVTYAGSAGVVLEPTKASERAKILGALDNLEAGGSTAGAEGIELAYQVAAQSKVKGGVNRVILATDGDFNVGIDEPDQLKDFIKSKRDEGISLSVLGFGRGNLDDALMQALAQNGNGNASYIDNFREAQKVLVEEGGANLVTIAKDVKVQVEFNPAQVSEYRLIGYETRALNREDFNNDAVDAGEIGAGHTVTALYEITPAGSGAGLNDPLRYGASSASKEPAPVSDELGFLKVRYKAPDGDVSKLITAPITKDLVVSDLSKTGDDQRFAAAVAAFGQKLKGSNYGEGMSWSEIADLANGAKGADANGYRAEFVQLVHLAQSLKADGGGAVEPTSVLPPDVN